MSETVSNKTHVPSSNIPYLQTPAVEVKGNIGILVADTASIQRSRSGIIIAREIRGDKLQSVLMIARKTDAPVQTVIDQRSMLLFGLVFGVISGLVLSIFRMLKKEPL